MSNALRKVDVDDVDQNEKTPVRFDPAKIAHSVPEIIDGTGIGRTTLYRAIAAGRLRAHKIGARTLILDDDLRAFLRSQPATGKGA